MKDKRKYIKKVPILCEGSLPKSKADRLKKLRTFANLGRHEMASPGSGISIYSLKSWESGRFGGIPRDGAERVIKQVAKKNIKCSLEWLLHGIGTPPTGTLAEISKDEDESCAANSQQIDEKQKEIFGNESSLITEELAFFKNQFKKTLDFKIEDDGLAPLYNPGEYVAGVEWQKKNFNSLDGLDCIVVTEDNKTYLRKFKVSEKKDRFTLECTNTGTRVAQPTLSDVKVLKAAPVIRHYKRNPEK